MQSSTTLCICSGLLAREVMNRISSLEGCRACCLFETTASHSWSGADAGNRWLPDPGKQDRLSGSLRIPTPQDLASEGLAWSMIPSCLADKLATGLRPSPAWGICSSSLVRIARVQQAPNSDARRCSHSMPLYSTRKPKSSWVIANVTILETRFGQHGTSLVSAKDTALPEPIPTGACGSTSKLLLLRDLLRQTAS